MRQTSLAIAFASVPRRRPATAPRATRTEGDGQRIRIRLAVASAQVFALRQTLHRAIGELARVYVVEVDHRHEETTLHVEVERGGRDAAMHAIMAALPAAEFGVTSVLATDHAGNDHAAH